MYGKIGVPLKKKNYNLNRPDERKNVNTNEIYIKKEITAKNKTAENTATPPALVLNPYVTKTLCTVNKLKNKSIKTGPPLKNDHTPYQSQCNTASNQMVKYEQTKRASYNLCYPIIRSGQEQNAI